MSKKKKKKNIPKLEDGRNIYTIKTKSGKTIKYTREYPLSSLSSKFKNHNRLKVFNAKGTKCVCCHTKGTKILNHIIFYKNGSFAEHVDLFDDNLTLLTVDHKKPKYLKGNNSLRNKQPMCSICNNNKGHKYIPILGQFAFFYRLQYLFKKHFLFENKKCKKNKTKINLKNIYNNFDYNFLLNNLKSKCKYC